MAVAMCTLRAQGSCSPAGVPRRYRSLNLPQCKKPYKRTLPPRSSSVASPRLPPRVRCRLALLVEDAGGREGGGAAQGLPVSGARPWHCNVRRASHSVRHHSPCQKHVLMCTPQNGVMFLAAWPVGTLHMLPLPISSTTLHPCAECHGALTNALRLPGPAVPRRPPLHLPPQRPRARRPTGRLLPAARRRSCSRSRSRRQRGLPARRPEQRHGRRRRGSGRRRRHGPPRGAFSSSGCLPWRQALQLLAVAPVQRPPPAAAQQRHRPRPCSCHGRCRCRPRRHCSTPSRDQTPQRREPWCPLRLWCSAWCAAGQCWMWEPTAPGSGRRGQGAGG